MVACSQCMKKLTAMVLKNRIDKTNKTTTLIFEKSPKNPVAITLLIKEFIFHIWLCKKDNNNIPMIKDIIIEVKSIKKITVRKYFTSFPF